MMEKSSVRQRDEIMPLMRQYGQGSLSYSAFQDGMQWFVRPDVGFIQYEKMETVVHNAICLGDPICAAAGTDKILAEFIQNFHDPVFIHITRPVAEHLNKMDFYANEMGVETEIDVQTFATTGAKKEYLRSQKNRAVKEGVKVCEIAAGNGSAGGDGAVSMERLHEISQQWLRHKAVHDHELTFLVRPAVFTDEPDVRKFVAVQGDQVIGFVFFDPMYRDGKVVGYLANILRTLGEHSYSVTDYIILEAMAAFRSEGIETLSLGFCPFLDVADKGDLKFSKPLQELFKYTYENANYLYSFKSLAFHKDRYRPGEPGARSVKVYCATKHSIPLISLYGVFRKMGIRPFEQSAEHAVACAEAMLKSVPPEMHGLIQHWRHGDIAL